jgi:hypothetical protein
VSRPQDDPTFIVAFQRWRTSSFPEGSPTDSVDELKADLAFVDAVVADNVIPFSKGRGWMAPMVDLDVPLAIRDLELRIEALIPDAGPDDRERLQRYRKYAAELLEVWISAKAALDS